MTSPGDQEAELRNWLVDYLVTNIGCSPDEIDLDAPMNELGVGSRDAVVLSGELSELLRRPISPVDFWQNPTLNSLAHALVNPDVEAADGGSGAAGPYVNEPIAVIGLGCRLPGDIHGPDALWDFLAAGRSAVGTVPDDRWQAFDDGSPETAAALANTTRWGSFLSDIAGFDAQFFGITPREADRIDPQQRLLLEVAVEALEHAGIPAETLKRSLTGVFAGACVSEYGYLAARDLGQIDAWSGTGGALSIIANRLSYFLDLRGPSLAVDTACSSSLVAVHLACQSLRTGQSELAIAAGVNLLLSPAVTRSFDAAGAMSPTGACHAFDAAADGFVRGEGCGVAVLKRLSDAVRDGDRVFAVVRGSAVNQDGRSNGLMAPNPAAQAAVLRAACADAGVEPSEIGYVEAHGTGTLLGDPIEARALGAVYGRGRQVDAPLLVGAAKTNLGHLEAAAGIVGLIKAILALHRGAIPANLHFETPNSHIPFDELRLKVVDQATEWPTTGRPRRAGVSSFGFGGTNAHVILEQGPEASAMEPATLAPAVTTLVVTGKTVDRMAEMATTLADWMADAGATVPLADVAHTLDHHRAHQGTFGTVCAADPTEAVAGLRALAAGQFATGVVGPHEGPCGYGTVFVYSGQGSQWTGMGRRLLADEPAFAAAVAQLEPDFLAEAGFSLQDALSSDRELTGIERIQPVLVGVQLALTALWRSYDVEPDAVIGHSMGEVTAAVVAGALTPAEGFRVIARRSQLMSKRAAKGAIALLELNAHAAEALIADFPGVTVAVYASPRQTVVAGPTEAVDAVVARAGQQNTFARRVNVDVASHHAMMDPILPELREALADLTPRPPVIPVISTVENVGAAALFDADHWVANLRNPVRFSQAVAAAGADHCTFIEISPHPLLTKAISDTLDEPGIGNAHHHSLGTLQRDAHDTVAFHSNLNATYTDQPPLGEHPPEPHPAIPTTPWHHTRHWIDVALPLSTNGFGVRQGPGSPKPIAAEDSPIPVDWLYEQTWPVRPLPAIDGAAVGPWLVVGDAELGAELGLGLPCDADKATLRAALANGHNVLYAPPSAGTAIDVESAYDLFNEARALVEELVSTSSTPRLFIVTRNAQPVTDGDRANPTHAVLWGLGRTLALEHPEIWGGVVDVDESMPAVLTARRVLDEAQAGRTGDHGEDQVAYRAAARHVPRLQRRAPAGRSSEISSETSHLVIGATGHIGPHLIQQLADMGAGTIVAVSRNPGVLLNDLGQRLSTTGTTLVQVAADVTDENAMAALFDRFGTELPTLEGIYLAAFAGGPVTLGDMTADDVDTMFQPKVDALSVLHALSLRTAVRQFVLFSSISGLLGSRWLAHYTATSNFLDTFARARRNLGLPATVVNWGLWKSLADVESGAGEVMSNAGLRPMPDEIAIRALPMVMGPDAPVQSVVVDADWPLLAAAYRTRGALRIVDDVLAGDSAGEPVTPESEFCKALRECAPERRRDVLADHLATLASDVMGLAPTAVLDPAMGFFQLGMDSLMSVTLQRSLSASLGITLPAAVIYEYPTISSLTDALCARMGYGVPAETLVTARSGLGARAQQRALARHGAQASRRKGPRG